MARELLRIRLFGKLFTVELGDGELTQRARELRIGGTGLTVLAPAIVAPPTPAPAPAVAAPAKKGGVSCGGLIITGVLAVVLVFWFLQGIAGDVRRRESGTCVDQAQSYLVGAKPLIDDVRDALAVVGAGSRSATLAAVDRLQETRRRLQALDVPLCAQDIKNHQLVSIDATIAALQALADDRTEEANAQLDIATNEAQIAATAVARLK